MWVHLAVILDRPRRAVVGAHRKAMRTVRYEDPRETFGVVVAYTAFAIMGITVLVMLGPDLPKGVWTVRLAAGVFLLIGGLVGALSAWFGRWWIERGAVTATGIGGVFRVFAILAYVDTLNLMSLLLSVCGWVAIVGLARARYVRVAAAPYREGAGPATPEQAAEEAARRLREAETQ